MKKTILRQFAVAAVIAVSGAAALAQQGTLSAADQQRRIDIGSRAAVDRRRRAQGDDADARRRAPGDRHLPPEERDRQGTRSIFVRTPYNFNFWDVQQRRAGRHERASSTAVKRGYAYVVQNERGHFFSEGNYDILGPPITDGYDTIDWLTKQPWSNGKVGTTGCSSTAEWQMGVAALGPSRLRGDERAGLRRRRRPRRPVLRAGQLVSRRRGADALHRLALRRAEPGAADVPAQHVAARI